jgi:hypothetical protein
MAKKILGFSHLQWDSSLLVVVFVAVQNGGKTRAIIIVGFDC